MKKNILITGGSGFIGSSLSLSLIKKGYNIRVLDNLSKQIHGDNPQSSHLYNLIKNQVEFFKGDVRKRKDWIEALDNQHIVVHLAAETGTGQSMYEIEKYTEVNIKGTSILLDILANNNHTIEKIVIASSRSIYGEGKYQCTEHGTVYPKERNEKDMLQGDFNVKCPYCGTNVKLLPTDELSQIHPSSIYGLTKQVQEEMCMIAGKSLNIPVVGFRYQNVYGPGQSLSNPYTGILSIFSTRIKNNNEINIFEDGKESRDFVFIQDVVDATILGIEKKEANYNVYNVGSGERTSVLDVMKNLLREYNTDIDYSISGNFRLGDIRDNYADLSKISNDLGFKPKVSFEQGIKLFCNWVSNQETQIDQYSKSFEEMRNKGLLK
ncbi:NAD-dependent epimerase/dehydratase family protein [Ichthyenterobacterium sp. W332]|uniref:NAD-dependent epimerase/dehydratase family protein n=1 Tax=Microcosmobacter mediterraneus TaxID=3075607 RepID=A0ABU2YIR5_9FLAO|nr:NAD-dependent epimerase/dehydratase family protein [Ichthyenterobacterium sp. W332]MDT0558065.1 NAD-dependent epimerase/dehydratase family protein [Ichthyenterobacterium sp. W332]